MKVDSVAQETKQLAKDKFYLKIAKLFSTRSHCLSVQVGAVCVKDDRIIATGINGTPSGNKNCDDIFDPLREDEIEAFHHDWSNLHEIHAEMNVILYAAKHGISIDGATLYSNIEPCIHCTKNLMQSGITRIVFAEEYYRNVNSESRKKFIEDNKNKIKFECVNE